MTPQSVWKFDLNEIPALEVRCKCGAVISLPLSAANLRERLACAGCNETLWGTEAEQDKTYLVLKSLIRSLSVWKDVQTKQFSVGFSLVSKMDR